MSSKKEKRETKNKTFGGRLKTAMGDISVYKLAQMTGLSHTVLHKYLQDVSIPGIDKADEIATALNVSFLWLTKGEGSMKLEENRNPDILAPENLKKITVDLYTVVSTIEDLSKKSRQQKKGTLPETLARDVALRCMRVPDR